MKMRFFSKIGRRRCAGAISVALSCLMIGPLCANAAAAFSPAPNLQTALAARMTGQNDISFEFDTQTQTILGYRGGDPSRALAIPASIGGVPVLHIGAEAFYEAPFASILLPQGLVTVGEKAFCGTSVSVAELSSVFRVESMAFAGCTQLDTVQMGAQLSFVAPDAFSDTTPSGFYLSRTRSSMTTTLLSSIPWGAPQTTPMHYLSEDPISFSHTIERAEDGTYYIDIQAHAESGDIKYIILPNRSVLHVYSPDWQTRYPVTGGDYTFTATDFGGNEISYTVTVADVSKLHITARDAIITAEDAASMTEARLLSIVEAYAVNTSGEQVPTTLSAGSLAAVQALSEHGQRAQITVCAVDPVSGETASRTVDVFLSTNLCTISLSIRPGDEDFGAIAATSATAPVGAPLRQVLPTATPAAGCRFGGWYTIKDEQSADENDLVEADITLIARFFPDRNDNAIDDRTESFTISFLDWDKTVLKTETLPYGSAITAPETPERLGYRFLGWDKSFDTAISDLTVTATYRKRSSGGSSGGTVTPTDPDTNVTPPADDDDSITDSITVPEPMPEPTPEPTPEPSPAPTPTPTPTPTPAPTPTPTPSTQQNASSGSNASGSSARPSANTQTASTTKRTETTAKAEDKDEKKETETERKLVVTITPETMSGSASSAFGSLGTPIDMDFAAGGSVDDTFSVEDGARPDGLSSPDNAAQRASRLLPFIGPALLLIGGLIPILRRPRQRKQRAKANS